MCGHQILKLTLLERFHPIPKEKAIIRVDSESLLVGNTNFYINRKIKARISRIVTPITVRLLCARVCNCVATTVRLIIRFLSLSFQNSVSSRRTGRNVVPPERPGAVGFRANRRLYTAHFCPNPALNLCNCEFIYRIQQITPRNSREQSGDYKRMFSFCSAANTSPCLIEFTF